MLSRQLLDSADVAWTAAPADGRGTIRPVFNPADHRDVVGQVIETTPEAARAAVASAEASHWSAEPVAARAAVLERAADAMQARMPFLLGLVMREAGKSLPNAIGEVREAIDFLRY